MFRVLRAPACFRAIFKIFYAFVCKNFSGCQLKFPGKIANKYVENLKQASGEIQAQVWPQKFVNRILCYEALV